MEKTINSNNSTFRELYGTNQTILNKQAERYNALIDKFNNVFGKKDIMLFSSPGVLKSAVITLTTIMAEFWQELSTWIILLLQQRITVILSVSFLQVMRSLKLICRTCLPDKAENFTSASIVRGVSARMKELGFAIGGFDCCIDSGVPVGSGLSSSASFEVLIGAIISHLFNNGKLEAVQNAIIGQYAENVYFGKPCGLMDQTACAVGGLVTIDFKDPSNPIVKKVNFDFVATGFSLVITDTGGNHADLNDEYASIPIDMKAVAASWVQRYSGRLVLIRFWILHPKFVKRLETGLSFVRFTFRKITSGL